MKKLLLAVFTLSLFAMSLNAAPPTCNDEDGNIPRLISTAGVR